MFRVNEKLLNSYRQERRRSETVLSCRWMIARQLTQSNELINTLSLFQTLLSVYKKNELNVHLFMWQTRQKIALMRFVERFMIGDL